MLLFESSERKVYPDILIGDDDDIPGLTVAGARRRARTGQDIVDVFRVEGLP